MPEDEVCQIVEGCGDFKLCNCKSVPNSASAYYELEGTILPLQNLESKPDA